MAPIHLCTYTHAPVQLVTLLLACCVVVTTYTHVPLLLVPFTTGLLSLYYSVLLQLLVSDDPPSEREPPTH
jgi:hypothetical protein